jgi:hypothetical protein
MASDVKADKQVRLLGIAIIGARIDCASTQLWSARGPKLCIFVSLNRRTQKETFPCCVVTISCPDFDFLNPASNIRLAGFSTQLGRCSDAIFNTIEIFDLLAKRRLQSPIPPRIREFYSDLLRVSGTHQENGADEPKKEPRNRPST